MTKPKDTDDGPKAGQEGEERPGEERPGEAFATLLRTHLARDPRRMSYQELAELTGLSKGYISLLAQGRRNPKPAVAERIGRVLGLKAREIAGLIESAGSSPRSSGGRPPGFLVGAAEPGSGEPLLVIESIQVGQSQTPRIEVHPSDRRGAVWLRAQTTGPGPGYVAVEATNGPNFSWITVTPEDPLQLLPIHGDAAVLKLGVDDAGQPRLVHQVVLGPRQFLGL
jgi:transcriptional regulator with XRE-family HTH domain